MSARSSDSNWPDEGWQYTFSYKGRIIKVTACAATEPEAKLAARLTAAFLVLG